MQAKNNSDPTRCVYNLVSLIKNEVPFARDKGVDPQFVDAPATQIEELDESIAELIDVYESRFTSSQIRVEHDDGGDFDIHIETDTDIPTDTDEGTIIVEDE